MDPQPFRSFELTNVLLIEDYDMSCFSGRFNSTPKSEDRIISDSSKLLLTPIPKHLNFYVPNQPFKLLGFFDRLVTSETEDTR